jgi:hypothetical protein
MLTHNDEAFLPWLQCCCNIPQVPALCGTKTGPAVNVIALQAQLVHTLGFVQYSKSAPICFNLCLACRSEAEDTQGF